MPDAVWCQRRAFPRRASGTTTWHCSCLHRPSTCDGWRQRLSTRCLKSLRAWCPLPPVSEPLLATWAGSVPCEGAPGPLCPMRPGLCVWAQLSGMMGMSPGRAGLGRARFRFAGFLLRRPLQYQLCILHFSLSLWGLHPETPVGTRIHFLFLSLCEIHSLSAQLSACFSWSL
jgi:hypothetical protein